MRTKMLLSEAWRSLTANLSTTFAAVITVLIGMALVGMLVGFGTYARSWTDKTKKELVVHVYFCTDQTCAAYATPKQIDRVRIQLQKNPQVKNVEFISKEQAFKTMQKDNPLLTKSVPHNPLPDAFSVTPKKGEYVDQIAKSLKPYPAGVEYIRYGKKTAHKILNVAHLIEVLFLVAVIILLIASTLLIANTIRLSIFARRREIEVMKLVGASNWFIRVPFLLEGLIEGLVGAALAVFAVWLGASSIAQATTGFALFRFDVSQQFFFQRGLLLLIFGAVAGVVGSMLGLSRYLRDAEGTGPDVPTGF
jgi:cell division transport system permease protein